MYNVVILFMKNGIFFILLLFDGGYNGRVEICVGLKSKRVKSKFHKEKSAVYQWREREISFLESLDPIQWSPKLILSSWFTI